MTRLASQPPQQSANDDRHQHMGSNGHAAAASTSAKPDVQAKTTTVTVTTWQLASTLSLLTFATIWGVLARLGLEWIGSFARDQVFELVWAQIVGCFIMGFVVANKTHIERIYPPWFVACGTGFCGSLTTFSSWMNQVFLAFANDGLPEFGRFHGFMNGLANTVVTLGMSYMALQIGSHVVAPDKHSSRHGQITRPSIVKVHALVTLIGPLFWIGAAMLVAFGPTSWRRRATFAIVLGPPGTLLRWYLARQLNSLTPRFPWGTFIANSSSDLLFAVLALLQRRSNVSATSCAALQGALDGFCGSLSTVSTFVVELRTLGRFDSYRYFLTSWTVGQTLMVVVLGSWIWSGDRPPSCALTSS
ncbi:hypothetical protein OIO90_005112 [Microbotryomycetes sp. JL221]|nr:hypothetical protein OIO90_005112 [Microbotryomycetes sp. JL221]